MSDASNEPPTSPTSPLAPYPPLPPVEYRSRAPEYYGFAVWSITYILYVVYLLWALLPDEYIVWLGITWYPRREWALLVPSWTIMLVLYVYIMYFALTLYNTPPSSDLSTIADSEAPLPETDSPYAYFEHAQPDAIPEMYDIPIGLVNRVSYRKFEEEHDC